MPPNQLFRPAEFGEVFSPQPGLSRAEKLVQLRRLHRGSAEHCVHLPTMMNLMFKQMRKHAQSAVMLRRIAGDGDDSAQIGIAHLLAIGDQPTIHMRLFLAQGRSLGKRARPE